MSAIKGNSPGPKRRLRGFSLVELMVAMSIAMIIIAAMLSSYTFLGRNLVRFANQQQLEVQSRRTLQTFASDVHMAERVANAYDPTQDITQDSSWQTIPTSSQVTFRLSTANGSGTFVYAVTYVYDTNAGTLTRSTSSGVGSGTPPASFSAGTLPLLSGLPRTGDPGGLWVGFKYLDGQGWTVSGSNYPARIKQISLGSFTVTNGTANAGTLSRLDGASARIVLRNKHLSN